MQRAHVVMIAIILLVTPSVAATWYGPGTAEPDTPHDREHGAWEDADATSGTDGRVYFSAFQAAPQTSTNPNVGATGSRVLAAPAANHRAILGIWKDCNDDGYIGLAESALQDYRSELLLDTTICPPSPGTAAFAFNDGQWVNELRTIGMVDPCEFEPDAIRTRDCAGVDAFAFNERVLYDNDTYVWGDAGAPASPPSTLCPLTPFPRGTTSSTGALIGSADCRSQRGIAKTVNAVDEDGRLGLRFDDSERPEDSDSLLNQPAPVSLFGDAGRDGVLSDDASNASFTAWDCDRPKGGADVRDPTGAAPRAITVSDPSGGRLTGPQFPQVILGVYFKDEDQDPATPGTLTVPLTDAEGSYASAPAPAPAPGDPLTASTWRASSHTLDGLAGDCDPSTGSPADAAYVAYAIESLSAAASGPKDRSTFTFTFYDGHRGFNPNVDPTTGATAPSDGGTLYFDHGRGGDGPLWSATAVHEQDPQVVDRATLQPASAQWFTYYARVGSQIVSAYQLPSAAGIYGADACAQPDASGWECDSGLWWKDPHGEDIRPRYAQGLPLGRLPGDTYHLRDVDCYDGTLHRAAPLRASLADFSDDGPCPALQGART